MGRECRLGRCLRDSVVQSCRHVKFRRARGVARGVGVEAAVGRDLPGGKCDRAVGSLHHTHGDLRAVDESLEYGDIAVGEGTDHRGRQLRGRAHDADAQCRATTCGLDHKRQADATLERRHHARCA